MADLNIHIRITPRAFRWGLASLLLSVMAQDLSSESVALTTYYPAPSGAYTKLLTTDNTVLARDGGTVNIGNVPGFIGQDQYSPPLIRLAIGGAYDPTGKPTNGGGLQLDSARMVFSKTDVPPSQGGGWFWFLNGQEPKGLLDINGKPLPWDMAAAIWGFNVDGTGKTIRTALLGGSAGIGMAIDNNGQVIIDRDYGAWSNNFQPGGALTLRSTKDPAVGALHVIGAVRLETGACANCVLVSDANGNATWQHLGTIPP